MPDTLRQHLRVLTKGNDEAAAMLEIIVAALHVWDDLIDKDRKPDDEEINTTFTALLTELPRNSFYRANVDAITPLLVTAIANWHTANLFERGTDRNEQEVAFVLRSSYVNILTYTAYICGGMAWARAITPEIRRFTHRETLAGFFRNLENEKFLRETSDVL